MPLVLDRAAEVIGQSAGNCEDRKHLQEVRKRRRILEGMRCIGVDVTAAIRSKHFDRDLRSHRPLHDSLRIDLLLDHHRLSVRAVDGLALVIKLRHLDAERFDERRRVIRFEILDHALRDEEDRKNQTDREQQVVARRA